MYEAIPDELKNQRAWVCAWNGSKVPMRPGERAAASSTNPDTWDTFEAAEKAVRLGWYDYAGYVFHDCGIVGIDIDCGFDADGLLSATGRDIVSLCRSYTEKSRSGRGVHIFLKGSLPFPGRNNGAGVEIYRTGRYFICTGRKLLYGDMIENQAAIDAVVAKYFPDVPKDGETKVPGRRKFYRPEWQKPEGGKIPLRPRYPTIRPGTRNDSLASLAGSLWGQGYDKGAVYRELLRVNASACVPPLPVREIQAIVESVTKYRR